MNNKSKYVFLSYIFLLLTVFLVVLLTKDIYYNIKSNSQVIKDIENQIEQKKQEYDMLLKIKSDIENKKIKDINFDKFLIDFREDELIQYFYSYANSNNGKLKIESISLDSGSINDFGFNEAKIDLNVSFLTEQDMLNMLNFLLNSEKYNIYIHNFSYPFGEKQENYKVNIPLKVLYKNNK